MSLMGIDIGTSGCKVSVFSESGKVLAHAYREYDIIVKYPGWKELDSFEVWSKVKSCIKEVAIKCIFDPIKAFAVSSFGEAMTPVSKEGKILGNCILGLDIRGQEYIKPFEEKVGKIQTYNINGNILDYFYSMPKLQWIRDNKAEFFEMTHKFLLWQDLIYYLMGCEPVTDYSLASRTLLLDMKARDWSDEILEASKLSKEMLPSLAPAGTDLGPISNVMADELGLPRGVRAVVGGHDQCCNSLGAGVVRPGMATFGIGTYICVTPTFSKIPDIQYTTNSMMGIEEHVVQELYVTLFYNGTGGSVLKWFRDNLAIVEKEQLETKGFYIYDKLTSEMPQEPSNIMVLPHFTPTGPPLFESRTSGVIAGLSLETTRGEIIKGLLEGTVYYIKECMENIERYGITVDEYRPTGGGAKSQAWLQIAADIMGKPFARPKMLEAGSFGAAMLAGVGIGVYDSTVKAVQELVEIETVINPDERKHHIYKEKLEKYKQFYPTMKEFLHGF